MKNYYGDLINETPMSLPKHISIIMDGNGRWAQAQGKDRLFGHQEGAKAVRQVIEAAAEIGIPFLSLFAFSSENWGRPKAEVDGLMELLVQAIHTEMPTLLQNNVRLLVIGERAHLPLRVQEHLEQTIQHTASCTGLTVILALSYSGTWDIVQAVNRYILERQEGKTTLEPLDQALFGRYLSTAGIPHPDLLIRTSGEQRISNFMLWQLAYTEFYFTEKLWPDFRREDLDRALKEYERRERRFGKTK